MQVTELGDIAISKAAAMSNAENYLDLPVQDTRSGLGGHQASADKWGNGWLGRQDSIKFGNTLKYIS